MRSVPLPPWGEACRPCILARRAAATGRVEAPPPTLLWCVAAGAQFVCSFSSNCSAVSATASMKYHLQLHYRLVKFILLVRTSAADPIMNISANPIMNMSSLRSLGTCGPAAVREVRCRARRAAAPGIVFRAGRGIATNRSRCATAAAMRRSGARRAIHPLGQGAPPPQGASLHRSHRFRESVALRRRHHLQLHCRLVDFNLLGLTSVPDLIMNMIELDHSC